ncbi:HET-domain-containing protein [Ganoderma leucocontextum]|nr:HET-domain-containing protein [Ganoderma leucocontextum]
MWLLSTDRAELHHFHSPEDVTGGYAILSHTWDKDEQTFQATQALREEGERTGKNPRDLASEKVRQCCILAESHGYQWIWDDTCCIDKTSSTELSEAINSMFVWYSLAEVCFAYLGDVEADCILDAPDSAFRTARWHSRGWTLQELIAPFLVIFVSRDWKTIGTKQELAPLLEEIKAGMRQQVLTRETHYSIASIAERMVWASKRSTTRVEDEAYCLMGLFNINMPTIYGEGRQAFQRLQQEIMKQSFDTSLFAWGAWVNSDDATSNAQQTIYRTIDVTDLSCHLYLLAKSPKDFGQPYGRTVHYTPSVTDPLQPYLDWQWKASTDELESDDRVRREHGPFARRELPSFSVTHYGAKCRFPIIESDGFTIAVLLCDTGHEHIGLILYPSNDPVQDPSRKKYHVGYGFQTHAGRFFRRLISLGNNFYNLNMRLNGKLETVTAEWRDIFIVDSPPPIKKDVAPSLCFPLHSIEPAPPFRLPHWLIGRLNQTGLQLQLQDLLSRPIAGEPMVVVTVFVDYVAREGVLIVLGTCMQSDGTPMRWANVLLFSQNNWGAGLHYSHDCHEHHVEAWLSWTKDFGDAERTVRLSFSRCRLTPEHTLVVHLELEGRVYDARKKRMNVTLPSREGLGLGTNAFGLHALSPPTGQPTNAKILALASESVRSIESARLDRVSDYLPPTNARNPAPASELESVGSISKRLGRVSDCLPRVQKRIAAWIRRT